MVENTTSLRGHYQQKETIHDYIILMGIEQRNNIKGGYSNKKQNYVNYESFREALQEYDYPNETVENRGNKNMKCFIDAANTKYEVDHNEYFFEYSLSTVCGTAIGALMLPIISHGLMNIAYCSRTHELPTYAYVVTTIIGMIAGGSLGYKGQYYIKEYDLEQQAFVDAAHECYNNIHKPVGELPPPEVDAY
ncbi:MAG: hypothetical protein N4A31_04590 [Rickettsiales bacterium]|jgi:hypothetical protein|nr:hypothetical protein [Rickettsiales bacterium]